MGLGGADNRVIIFEYARTDGLKMTLHPTDPVILSDEIAQTAEINDAPLVPEGHNNKKKFRHLLDVVPNWTGKVDKAAIKKHTSLGEYDQLPVPFRPKTNWEVAFSMQLHVIETARDVWSVVKWFRFESPQTAFTAIAKLCVGTPCSPDWIPNRPHETMKTLQACLERLGGSQIVFVSWPRAGNKDGAKEVKDVDKIKEAYHFIRVKGPKANNLGQFHEWTDIQVNSPDSPIYGWPEGKVKDILGTLMRGKQTAKTIDFWPFTYRDVEPWFFNEVMSHIIESHAEFGILWGGLTNCGKSMASKTHGMHVSEYHIVLDSREDLVPSIVTAKNLDFFRGEPNTKYKPSVGDDWQMARMRVEDVKAFVYPAEEDALLWARWGGAGFDMNSCRQGCTNPTDASLEAQMHDDDWAALHLFLQMIAPSMPNEAKEDDIKALLRRMHIIW